MKSILFICLLSIGMSSAWGQHAVKMQIQGTKLTVGASGKEVSWGERKIITKREAMDLLKRLYQSVPSSDRKKVESAYKKAQNFISRAPKNGVSTSGSKTSKSFKADGFKGSEARVDFELLKGGAFSNDRHVVIIRIMGDDFTGNKTWKKVSKHIVNKKDALDQLKRLWGQLSREQQKNRDRAYQDAIRYIKDCAENGTTNRKKVFKNSSVKKQERIEISIERGAAFSH
ncbi:hypothetical protein [uncultured Microscilla sp.]|uniref:hypothetical protein n=1 Tax=uncultured Microscilla sp. TaxID=432653 RepID=UPI002619D370|nr:hypothetical protein [uncultured Microscilla sp.]